MRKLTVLLFISVAGIIACGKKIMPESDTKNNQSKPVNEKEEKTAKQSGNANTAPDTAPSFNDMKGSQTPIADASRPGALDPGKNVYVTKCGGCHALKNPSDYTADQMSNILKVEIPKAKLNNKDAENVTMYLMANAKK